MIFGVSSGSSTLLLVGLSEEFSSIITLGAYIFWANIPLMTIAMIMARLFTRKMQDGRESIRIWISYRIVLFY